MEVIQRLSALLLVLFAGFCVMVWAVWFNPIFGEFVTLPLQATDFPGPTMYAPLIFAFGSFIVAYFIYPANDDD